MDEVGLGVMTCLLWMTTVVWWWTGDGEKVVEIFF